MIDNYLHNLQESSNLVFEELNYSDIKQIYPLMKRFNKDSVKTSYFKYEDENHDRRFKDLSSSKHIIQIAKDNNKIVGLVIGLTKKDPVGKISVVYVDKPYRGTGLAETLFTKVVDWLKKNNRPIIRVGVMGINERAKKFYKKMGFIEDTIQMRNKDSKSIKQVWT